MRCNLSRMKLYELSFSVGAETAFEGVPPHVFSPTGAAPFLQDEHGVEQLAISAANPTDNATVFLIPHFFINPPSKDWLTPNDATLHWAFGALGKNGCVMGNGCLLPPARAPAPVKKVFDG